MTSSDNGGMKDGGPAFPRTGMTVGSEVTDWSEPGMSLRQFAAIKLRVPSSGTDWLDEMIRESLKDTAANHALLGLLAAEREEDGFMTSKDAAFAAYDYAYWMLKWRKTSMGPED